MRSTVIAVPSLVDADVEQREIRIARIGGGIKDGLRKWAALPSDQAAIEIAESLITSEMRLSGIDDKEIRRRMHFLEQRTVRTKTRS